MKKHISYPKIGQFRNVVQAISREITFVGLDENDDPIYDSTVEKPVITFKGTVKLHGTNAGVCFNTNEGFWAQSRKNVITTQKDNAGFAFFAESNKGVLTTLIQDVSKRSFVSLNDNTVTIYGEWAGSGIQKGVSISQLEKAFYIFGVKVSPIDNEEGSYWIDSSGLSDESNRIFNVLDFETYSVDVDFSKPELSQNKFIEITQNVENECPISKAFGIDNGLGEGVVWSAEFNGNVHRFKVKGEKHSVTKVKTMASVDVEKLSSIHDFVDYAMTRQRFDQGVKEVFGAEDIDVKKLGDLIRWTVNDITSEEMDTMSENGLEPNDVNKYIAQKTKEMFFKEM